MAPRTLIRTFAALLALPLLVPCAAAQGTAPGSLLVFPEFDNRPGVAQTGSRVTTLQPILRYPGMLLSLGVLNTNPTPSAVSCSTSRRVSREKIPLPRHSGCVAVSTARTAEIDCAPARHVHRMNARSPTMCPSASATKTGDAPNGLA